MKPINLKNVWMNEEDFDDIDIFMTRECLYGFSLTSCIIKDPNDFDAYKNKDVNSY